MGISNLMTSYPQELQDLITRAAEKAEELHDGKMIKGEVVDKYAFLCALVEDPNVQTFMRNIDGTSPKVLTHTVNETFKKQFVEPEMFSDTASKMGVLTGHYRLDANIAKVFVQITRNEKYCPVECFRELLLQATNWPYEKICTFEGGNLDQVALAQAPNHLLQENCLHPAPL